MEKPSATGEALEKAIIKGLALFFLVILVYIPVTNGGYIHDDDSLLYNNPGIRRGHGWDAEAWKGLASFWWPVGANANVSADYMPLTSTTFWLEWRLWGNNGDINGPDADPAVRGIGSPGYHTTNIILHGIAALLLWCLLARLGVPGAWVAALAWAVHPVNVESVAWIMERRNILCMVFTLLAAINWLKFQRVRNWGAYSLAIFLFLLAMFAKSRTVMLPVALLLCIWWMRKRVTWRDLLETAPFFAVSLVFGIIMLNIQQRAIGNETIFMGSYFERFAGACFSLGFYLYKVVWPFNLNLIYQQWHRMLPQSLAGLAAELLIGAGMAAFFLLAWLRRATWGRHAIFGLGFFVIMIAPVLGFVKMSYMRFTLVSDHEQYVPMVGVIALCVAGLTVLYKRLQPSLRPALAAGGVAVIGAFCCLAWQRAAIFGDPDRVWSDSIAKNPDSWFGHSRMGGIYWSPSSKYQHNVGKAAEEWQKSAELAPHLYETHSNYGLALNAWSDVDDPANKQKHMDDALEQFRIAMTIDPEQTRVRTNYVSALLTTGQYELRNGKPGKADPYFENALRQCDIILKDESLNHGVYNLKGIIFLNMNRFDDAIASFQLAQSTFQQWMANYLRVPGFNQKNPDYDHNLQQALIMKGKAT